MSYVIKECYSNSIKKIDIYYQGPCKWTMIQKDAFRFADRMQALAVCDAFNRQGSNARIVNLKKKKNLQEPKPDTVFIDYSFPEPTPHIVVCCYLDRDDENPDMEPVEYVCCACGHSSRGDDIWGTVEEYHDYLAKGKIQVIWEPK